MFKGLGNLGNIASMVGKFQEIPERMRELNDRMRQERISASSECGHVTVTMNGIGEVQEVTMAAQAVSGEMDAETVSAAVVNATNQAGQKAKQTYAAAVQQMAVDMDLNFPGVDNLLANFTGGA